MSQSHRLQLHETLIVNQVKLFTSQYPVNKDSDSYLHFTPSQNCSIGHHVNTSWKHSTMLQLMHSYS